MAVVRYAYIKKTYISICIISLCRIRGYLKKKKKESCSKMRFAFVHNCNEKSLYFFFFFALVLCTLCNVVLFPSTRNFTPSRHYRGSLDRGA